MVLGVLDATSRIPEGSKVAVDGVAGVVRWMS
jgi:phosphohistidine swiveling domain-containing protein